MAKILDEKIKQIREVRKRGETQRQTAKECGVSQACVSKYCLDIDIFCSTKKKPKNGAYRIEKQRECNEYKFNELNLEDQKKYNECKPPIKSNDTKTFITGIKGDYGKAAVFEDYRAAHNGG